MWVNAAVGLSACCSSQRHAAHNLDNLKQLADYAGVKRSNFQQLAGLLKNSSASCRKTSTESAMNPACEKGGWRRLSVDGWIARKPWQGLPPVAPIPFFGKNGDNFLRELGHCFGDPKLSGSRLQKIALLSKVHLEPSIFA